MSNKKQHVQKKGGFISVHEQHKQDCRFIPDNANAGFQQPYKKPRKLTQQEFDAQRNAVEIAEQPVDEQLDIFDEELPETQRLDVSEQEDTMSQESESSDDEGEFRHHAQHVIQKNGYRTVQKWFELEAEPFRPKKKVKAEK